MIKTIQLPRNNAVMLYNLLEVKAHDLELFIQSNDYEGKHGRMAEAVRVADTAYLQDIRATQHIVNKAIGE